MTKKRPKKILSAGGPRNEVLRRLHPHDRFNRYKLKTTLGAPGVHTCLHLEIRSQ